MAKRENFLDLEDYGIERSPDRCTRVHVILEIDGHSDYLIGIMDNETGKEISFDSLTKRDQSIIQDWAEEEVKDWAAARLEDTRY